MGTGLADDVILKALGGAGATAVIVWLVVQGMKAFGAYLDKRDARDVEKDRLLAMSLKEFGTDVKSAMSEVRGAVDTLRGAMVDMDKSHTEYSRQNYLQLVSIIDKQNGANALVVTKVEHLDDTTKELSGRVERLNDTIEDHGVKLDLLARAVPGAAGIPGPRVPGQIEGKAGPAG